MRPSPVAVLAAALALPAAAAEFEGIIEARITMTGPQEEQRGSGTLRMQLARAGARTETRMTSAMGEMQMTMMTLRSKPGITYLVDDERKLYSELTSSGDEADEPEEKLQVKKLAPEKVAGHDCAHALLTDGKGEQTEIWATRALGDAQTFWAAFSGEDPRQSRKNREAARVLREAGIDGWPLKFRSTQEDGQVVTWEATRVEKRSLPASLFSLAGYSRAGPGAGPLGKVKLSPQQQRKLDEQQRELQESMKKLTPEQRKQMEELMRQVQPGGRPEED